VNSKSVALIRQLEQLKGLRVLDIGCNSGLYSCLAATTAKSVLGCDVEPVLIERARSAAKYFQPLIGSDNVEFRQGSFIEVLDHQFDAIVASLVLYHIGDMALDLLGQYLKAHKPMVILQARPERAKAFLANPDWQTVSTTTKYNGMYTVESNLEFLRDCGYESASVYGMNSTLFHGEYFPIVVARS
jgi:2-polyprenyl-3-methyl-5-hydroxy-6-metoxy-1,4-benzoquinol methylase